MRAIGIAFDEKIIPQTHVSLGALKEGMKQKWTRDTLDYTGTPKSNGTGKSAETCLKLIPTIVTLVEIRDKAIQCYDSGYDYII